MDKNVLLEVYPSQLPYFKKQAKNLAKAISKRTGTKPLSAFKRNDCLAKALGYKGHSDMVESAKFRVQSDTGAVLDLFSNDNISTSVAREFSRVIESIEEKDVIVAYNYLVNEHKEGLKLIKNYFIKQDQQDYKDGLGLRGLVERTRQKLPKSKYCQITVDVSYIPGLVYEELIANPCFRNHLSVFQNNCECTYSLITQNHSLSDASRDKDKNNWKLYVSFDGWVESELSGELLQHWEAFKDWLCLFHPTGHIKITERTHDDRWRHIHVQYRSDTTISDLRNRIEKTADRVLFDLMV